jgi:phage tail sheath protein FI
MPVVPALSYPGVYIQEIPSGVRTITGVATSITAFIGRALRGPVSEPVRVQSFGEFERTFGSLWSESTLGYAVAQFFLNGGGDALVVRVASPSPKVATATISGLKLVAANQGAQGNSLKVKIEDASSADVSQFKLTIVNPPAADVVVDNLAIANIDTALAPTPVRRDTSSPLPTSRPVNAALTSFTGGADGPAAATVTIGGLGLVAASPGAWGQKLRVRIENPGSDNKIFNLIVRDSVNGGTGVTERFLNVSTDPAAARYVTRVLNQQSSLVRATAVPATRPSASGAPPATGDPLEDNTSSTAFDGPGSDGVAITDNDISAPSMEGAKQGLWALQKADLFNLLCIPPLTHDGDLGTQTRNAAAAYCEKRRALFIVDPLRGWATHAAAITGVDDTTNFMSARSKNAALFFPLARSPDPQRDGQLTEFAPCGIVAGIMARTDGTRGVWKAPAGTDATLNGVSELTVKLTDRENGQLNPIGVNCLRSFPVIGQVVWGSRTLVGADQLANEWKYIPVRRTALYIEESVYRGTQWVVFEPNDEPLWAQIRLNIGAFMQNLFRQGAFQGKTPQEAYFVKCDKETTTQNDINLGIVNIIVGFAPLKPAEFVVIYLQQMAGQIQT